jgi:hypothetical protein
MELPGARRHRATSSTANGATVNQMSITDVELDEAPRAEVIESVEAIEHAERKAQLRAAIAESRQQHEEFVERQREQRYEANRRVWRREAKDAYAAKKAEKGETVRPYHWHEHAPQAPNESANDYKCRLDRDRAKTRYAAKQLASGKMVRPYIDLSDMTDEDRAAHKREQKARSGARKSAQKVADHPLYGQF